MEKRHLFKAQRVDNGEWVQGNILLDIEKNKPSETYRIYPVDHVDICRIVDETTICQCTGLKDKNGKLIWENDIVKDLFSDACAQIKYGSYQSCFDSTKTEHIGFYVDWLGKYTKNYRKDLGYWVNIVDAEIVGNIFDNKELLESEDPEDKGGKER